MKKYFNYFFCGILLLFPYLVSGKVTCSNGEYNAIIDINKTEISLSDNGNISISSDYEYEVSYDIKDKKIIEIDDNGGIKPINVGETKVNVIINFKDENETVSNCTSVLDIKVLSNDSSLKLLNLEELDISSVFQSDKLEYEVKLPYKYEKINIIAEANSKDAQITGDGRRYLNEGTNEYEIIVKATDGTSSTYKITILREDANDDSTLEKLIVEGYVLSPKFDKNIYEYSLNVDKNVEEVNINAEATYDLAKILGTGKYSLATGDNTFYINVTAENGSETKYKITINKSKGNSKLSKLEVDNFKLDKKFNSDLFIYNLTVDSNINKLKINAEAVDNDQIEIIGNENLKFGENNIIIRVSSDDKGATTYKLIVNKLSLEEQKIIEKNNLLLKILLIIFIISIIIMATFIIIFLKRNYKNKTINKNIKLKKQSNNKRKK